MPAAREVARELVAAFAKGPASQHRLAFTNELANLELRLGNYEAALPAYQHCLATAREWLVRFRDKTGILPDDPLPVAGFWSRDSIGRSIWPVPS